MKANNYGRACPDWCTENHQEPKSSPWCHGAKLGTPHAYATLEQESFETTPNLEAWVVGNSTAGPYTASAIVAETATEARWLADALGVLAGMKKADIRALEANVRTAVAEAWPEEEAEAS